MSGFEVGDCVECWREPDGNTESGWNPRIGGFYRVAGNDTGDDGSYIIDLFEDPECFSPDGAWEAAAFRLPRADADFTATIRACRPVKVGEVA